MNEEDEEFGSFSRMDFIPEVINSEEQEDGSTKIQFTLEPNPERYERTEIDGEGGYLDKFDDIFFSDSVLRDAAEKMSSTPIYHHPPRIEDIHRYIRQRGPAMKGLFDGEFEDHDFFDASEELLADLVEENDTKFVILSIDIVGSTDLNQQLGDKSFARIIRLFHREIALLTNQFHGRILKFKGDGLIAYFPDPNFTGMHDNAINCAICMRWIVLGGMNPVLETEDLPGINFRIGIDSGDAEIISLGVGGVKQEMDLIGETVNLASKIESVANTNEIYLGENTVHGLHTQYRKHTERVQSSQGWDYTKGDGDEYKLYHYTSFGSG